jgi:glycosyltransferase involved in cell wall biosynthesis
LREALVLGRDLHRALGAFRQRASPACERYNVLPVPSPDLSAIVLGYRAGEELRGLVERLLAVLDDDGVEYEVVLVANYWPEKADPTPGVAAELAHDRPHVRVVADEKQGAMGWDMRSGFEAATGEYLIVIDGDAENPVEDVLAIYRLMRDTGADVMKGRRTLRYDTLYRRTISLVYNVAFRVLFGTRGLWDINGKPKGLTRRVYERLDLRSDGWFIDAEIVIAARKLGFTVEEMPVKFFRNEGRESLVRPGAIWEFVVNMLRCRTGRRPT